MMPCLEMATHAVHFLSVTASVRHPAVELYTSTHYSCCWHVLTAERSCLRTTKHTCDVCKCVFNAEDNIWSTFGKEHKNYANWLRWLKLCEQIIHKLTFEWTKFEEIWWTYVGLMNIFMGSVFFGSPCILCSKTGRLLYWAFTLDYFIFLVWVERLYLVRVSSITWGAYFYYLYRYIWE